MSLLFAGHYNKCIMCIIKFNPNYNLMRKILCIIPISQLRKLELGQIKSVSKEKPKWNCTQICFASKLMLSTITPHYFNLLNKRIKEIRFFKNVNTWDIFKNMYLLLASLFIKRMKILGTQRQEKSYLTKDDYKMDL